MIKNNKYLNMLLAGILTAGFAACDDTNDWSTDSSYDRLFSPHNISVSAEATTATIEFDRLSGVDGYILEINTDTLYTEEQHAGSRIENIDASPYILTGLAGETKYFIRMKAVSITSTTPNSKWSYYVDGVRQSFTTKGEQILEGVGTADRGEDRITLNWEAGLDVTHISVANEEGNEIISYPLSDEEKAAGSCTIANLAPQTSYTFTIYNGTIKRGSRTASTTAAMPGADYRYELTAAETEINQELLDRLALEAQEAAGSTTSYSVTIGIPANAILSMQTLNSSGEVSPIAIPEGMSVNFFGLAGGERPVLNFVRTMNIAGAHGYIRFTNVKIADDGAQYLVNQSDAANVGELSFTECEVNNFSRSLVRLQGSSTKSISTLKIESCIVTEQGSGGYALLYFNNAAYTVSNIEITRSTFNSLQHSFIDMRNCNNEGVTIEQCTFYNTVGGSNNRYLIDANSTNVNIGITNTIFGKTYSETARGIRTSGTITINNLYKTTDCIFGNNNINADSSLREYSSDELFTDPANGDFTIKVTGFSGMGDPRWSE